MSLEGVYFWKNNTSFQIPPAPNTTDHANVTDCDLNNYFLELYVFIHCSPPPSLLTVLTKPLSHTPLLFIFIFCINFTGFQELAFNHNILLALSCQKCAWIPQANTENNLLQPIHIMHCCLVHMNFLFFLFNFPYVICDGQPMFPIHHVCTTE